MLIPISNLRLDGGTQPRALIDAELVKQYSEEMASGVAFPPVVAFYDGKEYWVADGFHRVGGAGISGLKDIDCDVHQGTLQDAQWYSFGANKAHGLRRTNEDKQRAVKAALAHPKGAEKSDHQIARHVGVDVKTVGNWRAKVQPPTMEIPQSAKRVGLDGRAINTANIGRSPGARAHAPQVEVPAAAPAEIDEPDEEVPVAPMESPKSEPARPESHSKRQQAIDAAAQRRLTSGLSEIRGICRWLPEINMDSARIGMSRADVKTWAAIAQECAAVLRDVSKSLAEIQSIAQAERIAGLMA